MKANYHTHTYLCNHANGNVEDYVTEAIKQGLEELGMSDHVPYKKGMFDFCDDEYSRTEAYIYRMTFDQMDSYLKEIEYCNLKYGDKIKVLKGFESEYIPGNDSYYRFLIDQVDYLILGNHMIFREDNGKKYHTSSFSIRTEDELKMYKEQSIVALKTGFFKIFAHPDIYMNSYKEFDELARETAIAIIETAIRENVILEFNANGIREHRRYPELEFWKLVSKYDVKVIVNSDCHDPSFLNDTSVRKSVELMRDLGIKIEEKI